MLGDEKGVELPETDGDDRDSNRRKERKKTRDAARDEKKVTRTENKREGSLG